MESISNGVEDYLIDGLSFKLPPGSSYITDRRKSTFWASGSNIYKAEGGTRVVRFLLNGEDGTWLDPQTIRVQFDLRNNETGTNESKRVRPLGGGHLFFRRARVLCNNMIAEDIQDYNRNHEMMLSLMPDAVRDNIDIENFGHRWDDHAQKHVHSWSTTTMPGIAPSTKQTVCFKPMLGLINQSKLLPVKYCPIVIELELCNSNLDPVITPNKKSKASDSVAQFTDANTGSNWSIENNCVKCDCCTLDNNLNNEYTAHLLGGKALPIKYSTLISQQSTISKNNVAVQVSRAVSRLQKAYITLYNPYPTEEIAWDKQSIKFYHPMEVDNAYNGDKELEFQIQLGGKLYPEYPCRSISEAFSILKQTMNLPDWGLHSVGIDFRQFTSNKFIFAMSFEKMPQASWSGTNTMTGQILLIKLNAVNTSTISGDIAQTMFITLQSENILEIRDSAVSVLE